MGKRVLRGVPARAAVAALGVAAVLTQPVGALGASAVTHKVAFNANERSGAVVAHDAAVGDGAQDGVIFGPGLTVGIPTTDPYASGRMYHFSYDGGAQIVVDDADELDPGTRDFSFQVDLQTDRLALGKTYNVAQKGKATDVNNWKMEVDTTHGSTAALPVLACVFDGDGRTTPLRVLSLATFGAGTWTVLKCERSGDRFSAIVNGQRTSVRDPAMGSITNDSPFVVGAKELGDVDTYLGNMDRVLYVLR